MVSTGLLFVPQTYHILLVIQVTIKGKLLFVCVTVRVCGQDISKSSQPMNFIFGGSLPCDPRKKPLDFE